MSGAVRGTHAIVGLFVPAVPPSGPVRVAVGSGTEPAWYRFTQTRRPTGPPPHARDAPGVPGHPRPGGTGPARHRRDGALRARPARARPPLPAGPVRVTAASGTEPAWSRFPATRRPTAPLVHAGDGAGAPAHPVPGGTGRPRHRRDVAVCAGPGSTRPTRCTSGFTPRELTR